MVFFARKFGSFFAFVQRYMADMHCVHLDGPPKSRSHIFPSSLGPHSKVRELGNRCITLSKDAPKVSNSSNLDLRHAKCMLADQQSSGTSSKLVTTSNK
jgi:hypothetical protein